MTGLTPAQKRILHTAPCCGHLIANHDGAGCVACTNDGERELDPCMESPATIETTYEAVAALVAAERVRLLVALAAQPDRMAEAWGRDAAWLTTGTKVAEVVRDWLADLSTELRWGATP